MTARGPALKLRLAGDDAALEPTRLAVLNFLQPFAPSARAAYAVELVLEELLTNHFKYATAHRADAVLELTLQLEPGAVVLHFADDGAPFDPLQAPAPPVPASIGEARVGGLGLVLIRRFARSATYEHRDGRNCLTVSVALD